MEILDIRFDVTEKINKKYLYHEWKDLPLKHYIKAFILPNFATGTLLYNYSALNSALWSIFSHCESQVFERVIHQNY